MDIKEYISSGILELYVLGSLSAGESQEVEKLAAQHAEISQEIENISLAIENYATENAIAPSPVVRPFLLATIDFMSRMQQGEVPSLPPVLSETSKVSDYTEWLNREDMILPNDVADDIYAKIIGYAPGALTAIVWIKTGTPPEVHTDEHEKFLIVEGTCDILVEGVATKLVPGDYFTIPLHKDHTVQVTTDVVCKVILQRIAA
jgi:mannose-6-phosphate isomerase-like protein (cupin superfamily)